MELLGPRGAGAPLENVKTKKLLLRAIGELEPRTLIAPFNNDKFEPLGAKAHISVKSCPSCTKLLAPLLITTLQTQSSSKASKFHLFFLSYPKRLLFYFGEKFSLSNYSNNKFNPIWTFGCFMTILYDN